MVAARRLVLGDQSPGEVISASRDQVHHEERQVGGDVDAAQSGIELDGVKDLDRVPLEDHMLGAQIAVAVADEAARGTILELLVASVQERDREAVRSRELPGPDRVCVGQQRAEVLADRGGHGPGVEASRRRRFGRPVKGSDMPRYGANEGRVGRASADKRGEGARLVEAPHLHDVLLAWVARSAQRPTAVRADQRPHAEVEVGRQPPTQPHLLLAHLPSSVGRAVVKEREHHRLAQLERPVSNEEDPADVRLDNLHRRWSVGVEVGRAHRLLGPSGVHDTTVRAAGNP